VKKKWIKGMKIKTPTKKAEAIKNGNIKRVKRANKMKKTNIKKQQ
jgi:hypothetical protein